MKCSPRWIVALLLALCGGALQSTEVLARATTGVQLPLEIESPRPYPSQPGSVWEEAFRQPGATYVMLRFEGFRLPPGDVLELEDGLGRVLARYEGRGRRDLGHFWSIAIPGEEVRLRLVLARVRPAQELAYGFRVVEVILGDPVLEHAGMVGRSVCGADDRRAAPCWPEDLQQASRAVARIVIGTESCTAWIASCRGEMVTARHCLATQADVDRATVFFEDELTACQGGSRKPSIPIGADRLLLASEELDLAVWTLDPEAEDVAARWGHLRLSPADADPSLGLAVPQHPAGGDKTIVANDECRITEISNGELRHGCDTSEGSSGAPLLARTDLAVVGLHTAGASYLGCEAAGGNRGSAISAIRKAIGALLDCAECELPAAPAGFSVRADCGSNALAWSHAPGAQSYQILRSSSCDGGFQEIGRVAGTSWIDVPADPSGSAAYVVRSETSCGLAQDSPCVVVIGRLPPRPPSTVQAWSDCSGVRIEGEPVPGAISYELLRGSGGCSSPALPVATSREPRFLDQGLAPGEQAGYVLRARNGCGPSPASACVAAERSAVPSPTAAPGLRVTGSCDRLELDWDEVPGARFYSVRRSTTGCGGDGALEIVAVVGGRSFADETVLDGVGYGYVVTASDGCWRDVSSTCAEGRTSPPPSAPAGAATRRCEGVRLVWEAVEGAVEYVVEGRDGECGESTGEWRVLGRTAVPAFVAMRRGDASGSFRVIAQGACGTAAIGACFAVAEEEESLSWCRDIAGDTESSEAR